MVAEFLADSEKKEDSRRTQGQSVFYYSAIRATTSCLKCHGTTSDPSRKAFNDKDLMAIAGDRASDQLLLAWCSPDPRLADFHGPHHRHSHHDGQLSDCPLHHRQTRQAFERSQRRHSLRVLLNVCKAKPTGDEFEDLSHAFNRMLRSLVSMQDSLSA